MYDKKFRATINHIAFPGEIKETEESFSVIVNYNLEYPNANIAIDTPYVGDNGVLYLKCNEGSDNCLVLNYIANYAGEIELERAGVGVFGSSRIINLVKVLDKYKGHNLQSLTINVDDIEA